MSGVKRTMEDKDPDYDDISMVRQNKRHKAIETSARDAAISKIESIVKEQFAIELKNKEHEIEIIDQRLTEARCMMDKLRAYIVANYYASAGVSKAQETTSSCDPTILNHPSIKKFMESPSRAASPANHRSDTPSANNSETDSVCTHSELDKDNQVLSKAMHKGTSPTDVNLVKDAASTENININDKSTGFAGSEDTSRRFVKKTIVVGNVSKYIPPDKREENDQSTHKWMIYVRGSRKEPSIDHFVKKVWFFLHPSYKPNDLVEVREPPFHLTRRGWGEFPVRVQIHFKDSQNKRIDIIHNLKLDRTYTGLQTLGAETVVEVELLRHSFGEDYLYSQSSNESSQSEGSAPGPTAIKSSPQKASHELTEKGYGAPDPTFYTQPSSLERTPTKMTQRFTIGAHGSTAFQPITASCKIVPQGQATSLAESPGKSFQPITMSCKIVSGSPTSNYSNVSQAGTRSPLPKIQGSSFITQNIKEESLFAAMPPLCPIGSHSKAQSPKPVAGGFGAFTKVIIKQEPIETSQQQETPSTSQPSLPQIVTVKGNQMIAVSPQKTINTVDGSKVVGIPVGSSAQASIKPSVTISGGQILVAKSSSSAAKAVGTKQIVAQGVAKAVVTSGSANVLSQATQNISKTPVASAVTTKTGSQGSVMATLQLPSTNLGNLANLPPGTKLYLTTNSKNTSGKGKLLLIPQGAILRAANTANLQSGASSSGGSSTGNTASGLPQHLTYTSYILKQTPQGTFLVGQPSAQISGKQATSSVTAPGSVGASVQGQQTLKLSSGQKGAIITQANSSTPGLVKISENVLKSLPVTSQTQKPGTTLLRVAGGVITASTTSLPSVSANGPAQQVTDGSSPSVPPAASSSKIPVQQPTAAQTSSLVKLVGSSKSGALPVPVLPSRGTLSPIPSTALPTVKSDPDSSNTLYHTGSPAVKLEENMESEPSSVKTEHLQNFKQLLTATVKKVPLIGERDEDGSNPFCASSLEQYYSWHIGKRRASEWQRAVSMKKMLQEIIETQAKFSNFTPLKTKEIVDWCRMHGYTPPDPENASDERESFEDVLTRIDNEAALPSSYSSPGALCQKIEELEKILKKDREVEEHVDILSIKVESKPQIKKENEEGDDVKFYLTPSLPSEFIRDTAQEIGVSLQPVEIHKNVYASPVEEMILKATGQFVSDLLRDALAVGYQMTSSKRAPREISVANIHQAICNIPLFDFLTNKHLGASHVDDALPLK
ncbi:YEATS domain-containing protein 2 isoform X2 [Bufo bufo]|uniref:YEATS domain-containing protein 2 isoform X2 n=1 Tax=Bufo bufo TaxID=8384 RepID=UPI001ABE2369|nr:YEATS domain-containing protein 2 isoform X2 [Bufo bufo]